MNDLTDNIITKGENIKQLKEKIYGTYVLEYKLNQLEKGYEKSKFKKID